MPSVVVSGRPEAQFGRLARSASRERLSCLRVMVSEGPQGRLEPSPLLVRGPWKEWSLWTLSPLVQGSSSGLGGRPSSLVRAVTASLELEATGRHRPREKA